MSGLHQEHLKGRIFVQRVFIVLVFYFLLIVILCARLAYLQIFKFNFFVNKAENNRIKVQILPPVRGNFVDRNNKALTKNIDSYDIVLFQSSENKQVVDKIQEILGLSKEQKNKIYRILYKNRNKPIVQILNHITWDDLVKLEANSYALKNIIIENNNKRKYLYDEEFAHILGYIASPSPSEIKELASQTKLDLLMNPNYKIGKIGLEKTLNDKLIGEIGYKKFEVNVIGLPIKNLETVSSKTTDDVKLTIDVDLQKYVYGLLKEKIGSAVVVDVNTGEILAMVSTPSFKTNNFIDGVSQSYWNEINNDPRKPMINRNISALYPPGSTFKPVVAVAALENGWPEEKQIYCGGITYFGPREFRCWKKDEGHGFLDIREALQRSCNIFFANLSIATGIEKIVDIAQVFGVGENFDIGLPNFKDGILPTKQWKKDRFHERWVRGDTINVGIGQGFLLMNPLQLAVMVSRIANGGYPIKPILLYNQNIINYNKNLVNNPPLISKKSIDLVKSSMYTVVNKQGGTAFFRRILQKDFEMAGKTGTAQVISLEAKAKIDKQKGEFSQFEHHSIFIGFAPYDKPKYGIAVLIQHGGAGSQNATPIAKEILLYAQQHKIAQ